MNEDLSKFILAGARFNRVIIDEANIGDPGIGELEVKINRGIIGISPHQLDGRPVIEILVQVKITATDQAIPIVDIECTAGFVGGQPSFDGDLEEFKDCRDYYARAVYWIIRSRLQTLAATTRLQLAGLPWDIEPDTAANTEMTAKKSMVKKSAKHATVKATTRQKKKD